MKPLGEIGPSSPNRVLSNSSITPVGRAIASMNTSRKSESAPSPTRSSKKPSGTSRLSRSKAKALSSPCRVPGKASVSASDPSSKKALNGPSASKPPPASAAAIASNVNSGGTT